MRVHRRGSIASGSWRAAPALLAAALAGCFSDRGVAIEVDVGATCASGTACATSVELFLGAEACDPKTNTAGITCASIAPPPEGTIALPGKVWFRDALAPETAEVKNGKATFQLRADTPTTLPIVIAVGQVGSGPDQRAVGVATLHDVSIPVDNARVLKTALARASATSKSPDDRVVSWTKSRPPSSCVMVEHGGTSPGTRDFIVPAEDPDCDDVPDPECNPAAYHGTSMVAGARDRPDCFSSSGGPACVLGAFGCTDGMPVTDNTCGPLASRTCIPQGFCGGGCNLFDDACMRPQLASSTVARIDCTVPTTLSLGNIGLCSAAVQATIDLGMVYPDGQCPDPAIGALPGIGFDTHHSFGGATMKLSGATRPCQFTVTWTDGTRTKTDGTDDIDVGILRFQPEVGPTRLLPIVFHFLPLAASCIATDFHCGYAGDPQDSMWTGCSN